MCWRAITRIAAAVTSHRSHTPNEYSIIKISSSLTIFISTFSNLVKLCSGGQSTRGTKCGCSRDGLWVRSSLEEMEYLIFSLWCRLKRTQPTQFGGKLGTECINTKFPLPTLPCAGYNVKLI